MKRLIDFRFLLWIGLALCMSNCSENCENCEAVVRGRVINDKTNSFIANAKIRALDEIAYSDQNGEFEFTLDLGKYILDYIEFEVDAESFNRELKKIRIVADVNSGEKLDFRLVPQDQIVFSPQPLELLENETQKKLNIINTGVNNVNVIIQPLDNWITVAPTSGSVAPNEDFAIEVSTNTSSFECLASGQIEIRQMDKNKRDTISVTKFITDTEIPLASFTFSPGIGLQFEEIYFDATASSDNCQSASPFSIRWRWDANEGFTPWDSAYQKQHTYDTYGQKEVTLEVKDGSGNASSITKNIQVSIAPTAPTVELGLTSETDYLSLIVGATIIDIGQLSAGIVTHGVVWSNTNNTPNLDNNLGFTEASEQAGTGGFVSEVTGLRIDQTYFIRAYARNENGVGYSEVVEVTPNLLDMVWVDHGTFRMGDDDIDTNDNNSPEHDVILNTGFNISKYEITNQQYVVFLNDAADLPTALEWLNINDEKCRISYQNNRFIVENGFENHPVVSVSWEGANEFCNWIGGRLPTEAEWEFSARGGNAVHPSDYTLYSGSNSPGQVAYFITNSNQEVHPVGEKQPNELGLFDMSGNVSEWCQDWYDYSYYSSSPIQNPMGPPGGIKKIARGGNYGVAKELITVFYREHRTPATQNNHFGFRSVK